MKKSKPKAFIFGAGDWGRGYLPFIKESYDILGYLDNNANLWNSKISGLEVFPPSIVEQRKFDIIIIAMRIPNSDKGLETYRAINKQLSYYKVEKSKIIPVNKLPKPFSNHKVEIHLTEHCNLNCAGCDHFSNIAKEEFVNIKSFEKDLSRLSELTDKDVNTIQLLGGEPLLHPEVIKLIDLTRKYFNRTTRIGLLTNGILLPKQPPEFWECAKRNGLVIVISHYPVKLDINKIKKLSVQYSVTVGYDDTIMSYSNFTDIVPKPMCKKNYDLTGSGDITEKFYVCLHSARCIQLKNGQLYPCSHVAHSEHFFNKFGFLKKCAKDSINIHKANSAEELINFVSKPIPFCRFCGKMEYNLEWKQSKREISEWT
jgi:sulfatase maturation enzyme AslB (radical SAM superfamily)